MMKQTLVVRVWATRYQPWAPVSVGVPQWRRFSCTSSCFALHTWSTTTTALQTGIFHFLFSVTQHGSLPPPPLPHKSYQTNRQVVLYKWVNGVNNTHSRQRYNSRPGISGLLPTQLLLLLSSFANVRQWSYKAGMRSQCRNTMQASELSNICGNL